MSTQSSIKSIIYVPTIAPLNSHDGVVFSKAKDQVRLCFPLTITQLNFADVALQLSKIRCSDGLCSPLMKHLCGELFRFFEAPSMAVEASALLCARLASLLPPVLFEGTPLQTSFLEMLLTACEAQLDSRFITRATRPSSLSGETHTWSRAVSLLSLLSRDLPVLPLLSQKLLVFLTAPNSSYSSSRPCLWLEVTKSHILDAKSDPLISCVYRFAFKFPRVASQRTRFALLDFCEQWQHHSLTVTIVQRRQFYRARAFLRLIANARQFSDRNGGPHAPLTRLPLDLVVLIASCLAPSCQDLRRCYLEECAVALEQSCAAALAHTAAPAVASSV